MFKLTGFGDEISPDINEQVKLLVSEHIKYIDLRGYEDKNIVTWTDSDMQIVKDAIDKSGLKVSCIASPIGKVRIIDDFESELEKLDKAIKLSKFFRTRYIRIFTYYPPENEKIENYRKEVIKRIKELVSVAKKNDIVLLVENEGGVYCDIPSRCKDLLDTINSPNLRFLYDPGNFSHIGIKPFEEAYNVLRRYIEYVHVKDSKLNSPIFVPAGEGDVNYDAIFLNLDKSKFNGFVSLEPHLSASGKFNGCTGPELYLKAISSLKSILTKLSINYC